MTNLQMRMAVRSVAKQFPTAIVSGRCRDKVFEFVKLAELYYAGSHGMDIKGPAKSSSGHAKSKVNKSSSRPSPIKHGRPIYLSPHIYSHEYSDLITHTSPLKPYTFCPSRRPKESCSSQQASSCP